MWTLWPGTSASCWSAPSADWAAYPVRGSTASRIRRAGPEEVGIVPFNLGAVPQALAAAVLGNEGGIGVRHGCFCAHHCVVRRPNVGESEQRGWRTHGLAGDRTEVHGMVLSSVGRCNDACDIDRWIAALKRVAADDYDGEYRVERSSREYEPVGHVQPLGDFCPWMRRNGDGT